MAYFKELCVLLLFINMQYPIYAQKNTIEIYTTIGYYKSFPGISYQHLFEKSAIKFSVGGNNLNLFNLNNDPVLYRKGYPFTMTYLFVFPLGKRQKNKLPVIYFGAELRYLRYKESYHVRYYYYSILVDTTYKFDRRLLSLGPNIGIHVSPFKHLSLNASITYPFYYPPAKKDRMMLGQEKKSKETPFAGGALEFNIGLGFCFGYKKHQNKLL